MMKLTELKELIKGLVNDSTSTEDAEKIGKINKVIEDAEKEHESLITKHEELRAKYVKAITETSFSEKPKDENPQPKSLEDCMQEVIDNRKD